jgi:capsid protein
MAAPCWRAHAIWRVEFRRRIEAMQHHVMIYQFCRPVWQRWLDDSVLAQALARRRELRRVKWIPPKCGNRSIR